MLDLSFLTEEEKAAILNVLRRDADLKKKEEDRCKVLKQKVEDEKKLKVLTGEWFYEVKGKRHEDRLHGSDLVRASMRKSKLPQRPGDGGRRNRKDREDKENKNKTLQLEDGIANERSEEKHSASKSTLNQMPSFGGTSANRDQDTSSSKKTSSFESDGAENELEIKPADEEAKPQTLAALAKMIDASDVAEVQTLLNVDVTALADADLQLPEPKPAPIAAGQAPRVKESVEPPKSGFGQQAAPVPRARTTLPELNSGRSRDNVESNAQQIPAKGAIKPAGGAPSRHDAAAASTNNANDAYGTKKPFGKLGGSTDSLNESEDGAGPRGILKRSSMSSSDSSLDGPPRSRLAKAISDVHLPPEVMHEKSKIANEDAQEPEGGEDPEGRHVRFNSNIQHVEVETEFNSPEHAGEGNILDDSEESVTSEEEEEEDDEEDKETEENTLKNAATNSTNPFASDDLAADDDLLQDLGIDDGGYSSNPFTSHSTVDPWGKEPERELPPLNRGAKTAASEDFWADDADVKLPRSLDPAGPQGRPKVHNESEDLLDEDSDGAFPPSKSGDVQKRPRGAVPDLTDEADENRPPSMKPTGVQMQPKVARSADLLAENDENDENELQSSDPAGLGRPAKPGARNDTGRPLHQRAPADTSKKPRQDGRTEIAKAAPSPTDRARRDYSGDDDNDADDDPRGDLDDRRPVVAGRKNPAAEPANEPGRREGGRGPATPEATRDAGAVPPSDSDEEADRGETPSAQSQTSSLERTGKPKSLQYPSDGSDGQQKVTRHSVAPQVERWLEDAGAAVASTLPANARTAKAGLTDAERKKQMSRSVPALTVSGEDGEQGIDIDSEDSGSFKLRRAPSEVSSISGSMMSLYSDAGDYGNVDVKGEVNFAIKYDERRTELQVCVAQCRDLAAAVAKKGRSDPYVKTYLLPDKSRQSKKKTTIKKNNLNPVYNEILKYKIPARELQSRVLNLSVWHNDKFGKNSFLGEVEMELSTWDWANTAYNWFDLQPRVQISQEDLTSRGYLNLALKYIPANSVGQFTPASGEIHIWVKEAKNLLPLKPHGVDAFVKCYILPDLSRKSRQKTRTVKKSMNPVFNHTMVYDGFQDEDLREACVELTVWDQETFSNQFLGGLRLGLGGGMSYGKPVDWMDSREGEVAVWHNMITRPSEWTEALLPLRPDMGKSKK